MVKAEVRTMSAHLERKAKDKEWPLDDVAEMLDKFSEFQVEIAMDRMSLDQAKQIFTGAPAPADAPLFTDEQSEYIDGLRQGNYNLSWLDDERPTWGVRATPSARGLTLMDINQAYAGVPEDEAPTDSMAPRGAPVR